MATVQLFPLSRFFNFLVCDWSRLVPGSTVSLILVHFSCSIYLAWPYIHSNKQRGEKHGHESIALKTQVLEVDFLRRQFIEKCEMQVQNKENIDSNQCSKKAGLKPNIQYCKVKFRFRVGMAIFQGRSYYAYLTEPFHLCFWILLLVLLIQPFRRHKSNRWN